VRRGDARGRLDVAYVLAKNSVAGATAYKKVAVSKLCNSFSSGGTPSTAHLEYWGGTILWVSPKDFSDSADLHDSQLYISEEGAKSSRLVIHPVGTVVLVVRSGVLAHTLPASVLTVPATINQDIKALGLAECILPKFFAYYLRIHQDSLLPLIRKHGATVHSINSPEFLDLEIPVPPLDIQRRLVAELDAARIERNQALAEADEAISGFEEWALGAMGVVATQPKRRSTFAVHIGAAQSRLDPFHHLPEFIGIERAITSAPHARLGDLVTFSMDTWNPINHPEPTFRYIEISGVDRGRGKAIASAIATDEAPSRARMAVQPGDLIVSLTRPHHGSIALLGPEHQDCVASTGFAVIRNVTGKSSARFLWAVLRLSSSLRQMLRRASGGNYPAITQDELANILVPLPDINTQQRVINEAVRRSLEADALEAKAETVWQQARERFEQQLLKGDAS
jgi:type I restriction enzyme S subunit